MVVAPDEQTAAAKVKARYTLNGLADFTCTVMDTVGWWIELVSEEKQS
ncbi:hypothetical protein KUL72_32040 [Bradyrhizobium arachidis]|nr:hypothetical protein [Bradyrhizobium arachidis]UVO35885.1 hypothetical protein KUL72_32040 [Bradyrhizobium arachidis]